MTKNQIEYAKYLETKRSNLANEALTNRRDTGTLKLRDRELDETQLHNRNVESISLGELGVHQQNAVSQSRQADAAMRQSSAALANADTNRMSAYEQQRHNLETESQGVQNIAIGQQNADAKTSEAATSAANLDLVRDRNEIEGRKVDVANEANDIRKKELTQRYVDTGLDFISSSRRDAQNLAKTLIPILLGG